MDANINANLNPNPEPNANPQRETKISKPGLAGLPSEILVTIFEITGERSLYNLSSVCKKFHGLATAVMYESLFHVIHHDDPILTQRSLARFTGMMEAVNSSNQKYGDLIKTLAVKQIPRFESDKQPVLSKKPEQTSETGRFLGALVAITLSRTGGLRRFDWDIRLELTPSVFRALGKIPELTNVRLRLPVRQRVASAELVIGKMLRAAHYHFSENNLPTPLSQNISPTVEAQILRELGQARNTQTLSRFSGLKSLAVLEIEDLKVLLELSQCISQCSSTLKSLELSFSDELAKRSRKRTLGNTAHVELSAQEGFMMNGQLSNTTLEQLLSPVAPANPPLPPDPIIRRERLIQELVLSYIFKVCDSSRKDMGLEKALESEFQGTYTQYTPMPEEVQDRKFVRSLRSLSRILPRMMVVNSESTSILQVLTKLDKATSQYLGRHPQHKKTSLSDAALENKSVPDFNAPPQPTLASSSKLHPFVAPSVKQKESDPTDFIDMEYPDVIESEGEDQEFLDDDAEVYHPVEDCKGKKPMQATAELGKLQIPKDVKGKQPVRGGLAKEPGPSFDKTLEEYIQNTHGIPLERLSIHLIPVTPIVLSHAVDMFALRHLSLLNVGPQGHLWVLLKRFNQMRTLQLTSIHTDNVTPAFMSFVGSMERITELFLFERSSSSKVESLAAKSTITIVSIRKDILARHIHHLRRLVIRNDDTNNWAADARSVQLITHHGTSLIELGLPICTNSLHYIIQQIGGMTSLVALQLFWHRADMCSSMLREVQSSLVDSILHFSHLRIEYVAMCYIMYGPVANSAIQIKGRVAHLADADVLDVEEAAIGSPTLTDYLPANTAFSMAEGEEDVGIMIGIEVNTRVNLKIEDISGIKMWEKGTWEMRL
ncbi:hypothetical protein BO70DRAFT_426470 [Aspergillus heteromorphus CBS 117.55]|uniref:F-box domain-containing protein n=1 Tax=Aspergillus heteromorphus CBS 117.55 TaxID=1448321 RepID=A0A317WW25_9EURO|nr:uncharacterized protein BO70DRAFT_426470 [Aspergillus heteromorphus CBS 117.55]PWY90081.1 hypothetical protein BO70DRAFT_426470 [Aspergillus heteromorphus CBS 117.55]